MSNKITISTESGQVITIQDNKGAVSQEGFGLSEVIALRDASSLSQMFSQSDVQDAIQKVKDYAAKKKCQLATIDEAKHNKRNLIADFFRRGGKIGQYVKSDVAELINKIAGGSNLQFINKDGVTFEYVKIYASQAERFALSGGSNYVPLQWIPGIIRSYNGKAMFLFYAVFKKPNGEVFIKHFCKAVLTEQIKGRGD